MAEQAEVIDGSVLPDAYKRKFEEIIGVTDVTRPTKEASGAITIGMGARRNITLHRPEILKLHTIDAQLVNSVEDYLYAFAHAHTLDVRARTTASASAPAPFTP